MKNPVRQPPLASVPPSSALVYAPFFPPATDGGGPIRSLAAFVDHAPNAWTVRVATSDRDLGATVRLPVTSNSWSTWQRVPVFYASVDRLGGLIALWRLLHTAHPDVVYVNSFFNVKFSLVPQVLATIKRRPPMVVVATRGELGAGALGRRSAKKKLLTVVYRALRQHRRVVFHASSDLEQRDIQRHLGSDVDIVVRRNETLLPIAAETTPAPPDVRIIFVGRIVPHKGLLVLLRALGDYASPINLDIYGAEEDAEYVETCQAEAAKLPHNITFHGSIEHEQILEAIRRATLLALPTAGENFGHVVVEALSVGCPVVVADTTPWSTHIRSSDAGVVVDTAQPESWARALRFVTTLSQDDQNALRGRAAASFDSWQTEAGDHLLQMLQ
jgi:glycosyltransferase involved in cell wall biosynthesis